MGDKSKIEWTDATWNPVRGCGIISEGCRNCYAMRQAHRQSAPGKAYEGLTRIGAHGPTWTGDVRFVPEMLDYPLRLKKPHRIFVNSMSDLFHEKMSDLDIEAIFGVMATASHHVFQILTKRPARMLEFLSKATHEGCVAAMLIKGVATHSPNGRRCRIDTMPRGWPWPLENVWLGVSVEDQKTADERTALLLETSAAVRWISAEPLLGPIDLTNIDASAWETTSIWNAVEGRIARDSESGMEGEPLPKLDWVVVGGESGPGARPMHPDWVRSLRDQCVAAGVPFFFKQWGRYAPQSGCDDPCGRCVAAMPDGSITGTEWEAGSHLRGAIQMHPLGKKAAGHLLDGREWREYPEIHSKSEAHEQATEGRG